MPTQKRLSVRFIHATGDDAQIGVRSNLQTRVIIKKVFYVSKQAGSTVEGVKDKPMTVKPDEETKFTVYVPSTLEPNPLSIQLTFYAETHGVQITEEITVYDDGN